MAKNHDKYKNHSLEELINELEALKEKKYGLVWDKKNSQEILDAFVSWENMPENFTPKQFPVLKEVKNKEIENDENKPVNLLIEGENYHSLAVLNFTHQNKVDVIYIDPPYNTGNQNFIFNDKFVDKEDPWRHSKWLSFMEKRLNLAKKLLKNTGVIFVSIDDHEQAQLRLLCNEIFGEENFIDSIIWKKTENIKMDSKFLSQNKDYILCYRKSSKISEFAKEQSTIDRFKLEDEKSKYYLRKLDSLSSSYSKGMDYIIEHKGIKYYAGGSKEKYEQRQYENPRKKAPTWLWSKKKYEEGLANNEIIFKNGNIYNKVRYDGFAKKPFINIQKLVSQQTAQKELDEMFGKRVFDHPKPPQLITWLISLIQNNESAIILDFFAGSGTTGQAVLDLNKKDNGNRKFILCTNNENNICTDVCYPRVGKVINGYKNSKSKKVAGLGGNLKYFKTDFVGSDSTDKNKRDLVNKSAEMICVKEDIFDLIVDKGFDYKIYQKGKKFLGVIFDIDAIADFKKEAEKHKGNFVVYCFSYTEATPEKEFKGLKNKYVLKPIPAVILRIYLEIFKK